METLPCPRKHGPTHRACATITHSRMLLVSDSSCFQAPGNDCNRIIFPAGEPAGTDRPAAGPYRDKKKAAPRSRPAPIVTSRQSSVYLRKILAVLFQAGSSKVLAVALLALFKTLLTNYQGKLQGNLFKTAFLKQVSPFARLLLENVAICLVTSTVESTSRHLLSRLDIQWRGLLTRRIQDKYFANMVRSSLNCLE